MPLSNPFSEFIANQFGAPINPLDPVFRTLNESSPNPGSGYGIDPVRLAYMKKAGYTAPTSTDPVFAALHPTSRTSQSPPLGEGAFTSGTPGGSISYSSTLGNGSGGVYQWRDQINSASAQTGVPAQVIAAIMQIESGGTNHTTPNVAGALGLMQVLPKYHASRAEKYGYSVTDPQGNILAGADFLKELHDKALSSYSGIDEGKAWNIAAAAYLGGWDWSSGSYSGAKDAFGTDGSTYVQKFDSALSQFGGLPSGSQSTTLSSGGVASGAAQSAIDIASKFQGQPYVWGGANPSQGFDCSGLVQYSFKQAGINLPRTAQEQYNATQRIDASQLKAGDLIFFTGTYNAGVPVTHVGIYLGNGKMLDSQSAGISIDDLNSTYWQQHLYGYGRVG